MNAEEIVSCYYSTKEKYDNVTKKFDEIKKDFYSIMSKEMKDESKAVFESFSDSYEVTKVTRKKVSFDIEKLERSLDKETLKQIITKRYQVVNTEEFLKYLKDLGADSNIIKQYIISTKEVNESAIDRLSELGKIDEQKVANAATVTYSEPYYKVKKL